MGVKDHGQCIVNSYTDQWRREVSLFVCLQKKMTIVLPVVFLVTSQVYEAGTT
jgi:hypothetical protein